MRLVGRPRRAAQLLRTCNLYGHDTAQAFHLALLQTEGLIASIFGVLSVLLSSPAGAPLAPLKGEGETPPPLSRPSKLRLSAKS
jgi:hypothetical protein